MLIKKIPENTGGLIDTLALEKGGEVMSLAAGAAANASDFNHQKMQARRLRRQFRMARGGSKHTGGWAIRAW